LIVVILLVGIFAATLAAQSQSAVVADLKAKFKEGYGALGWACLYLGRNAKQFAEIAIVNHRFERPGYVYERPSKCSTLDKMPLAGQTRKNAVWGVTH
jgi:hypothetical protein